jgi:hypothetical protein
MGSIARSNNFVCTVAAANLSFRIHFSRGMINLLKFGTFYMNTQNLINSTLIGSILVENAILGQL